VTRVFSCHVTPRHDTAHSTHAQVTHTLFPFVSHISRRTLPPHTPYTPPRTLISHYRLKNSVQVRQVGLSCAPTMCTRPLVVHVYTTRYGAPPVPTRGSRGSPAHLRCPSVQLCSQSPEPFHDHGPVPNEGPHWCNTRSAKAG
jgi:hypothetical protein